MAIKESITVRCDGDGCKNYADVHEKQVRPVGWYQVRLVDDAGRPGQAGSFDLCSLRCLSRWAHGRAEVVGEPLGDERRNGNAHRRPYEKTITCPFCPEGNGRRFAAQGFSHHVRSTHPDHSYEEALEAVTAP